MSIFVEILNRIQEGRLIELAPALPNQPAIRRMVVAHEIADIVHGPWEDSDWAIRCNYLRADIDRFITGSRIPVSGGRYGGDSDFKQLVPSRDEIWELRSRSHDPGLRVFGRFAAFDVFVALSWQKRSDLGGPKSRSWRDAKVHCATDWKNLFPAYDPIHENAAADFRAYVSNYFLV